ASALFPSQSSPIIVSFFFQAEDGIRDRNVTGVQTCALPILLQQEQNLAGQTGAQGLGAHLHGGDALGHVQVLGVVVEARQRRNRSEERRVGKECRWRWARAQQRRREWGERGGRGGKGVSGCE